MRRDLQLGFLTRCSYLLEFFSHVNSNAESFSPRLHLKFNVQFVIIVVEYIVHLVQQTKIKLGMVGYL